jgi:dCTP deaminase
LTFWSGDKIAKRFAEEPKIVDPYHESRIDCSAYTLTLGEQYFITPNHDMKDRESIRQSLAAPTTQTGAGSVSIPAGQFAFLLTEETLAMPHNVMGLISMKARIKFKGLINVSGFHVDPGFQGKLVFGVYNAGPSAVNLSRGDRLFLLWLADLDDDASEKKSRKDKPPLTEISSDIINGVNRPIHSLQNLSKKIDDLESSLKLFRNSVVVTVTVLGLAFSAFKFWSANDSPYLKANGTVQNGVVINSAPTAPTAKANPSSAANPKK